MNKSELECSIVSRTFCQNAGLFSKGCFVLLFCFVGAFNKGCFVSFSWCICRHIQLCHNCSLDDMNLNRTYCRIRGIKM